jgi:hypothetical protein
MVAGMGLETFRRGRFEGPEASLSDNRRLRVDGAADEGAETGRDLDEPSSILNRGRIRKNRLQT